MLINGMHSSPIVIPDCHSRLSFPIAMHVHVTVRLW